MLGFGLIGFLDDYLKVVLHRSDGLLAWQKMLCQIVVTGIFAYYMIEVSDVFPETADSFFRRKSRGYRLAGSPAAVYRGDRHRQRV